MTTDLARQAAERGIAVADPKALAVATETILATGDLSKLTPEGRVAFYMEQCRSLGLNSLSRPFDWLTLQGKLVLYPNKSCAEQLRRQHQISVKVTRREIVGDLFVCEVEGRTPSGRTDEASKYVPLKDARGNKLAGADLANAFAKAETSAKRRLVLSMIGLSSPPDPDEMRGARLVTVDAYGNVIDHPTAEQRYLAEAPTAARAIGAPTFETVGAGASPVQSTASQEARPEELERPQRPAGPPVTFKASDEEVKRWLGAWFAAVQDTSLDGDDARHNFVAAWTADEWPRAKRTDSLRTAFARMTAGEARDFLAHVRALCEDERRALLEDADAAREPAPRHADQRVHDAAVLTGAPAYADDQADDSDGQTAF